MRSIWRAVDRSISAAPGPAFPLIDVEIECFFHLQAAANSYPNSTRDPHIGSSLTLTHPFGHTTHNTTQAGQARRQLFVPGAPLAIVLCCPLQLPQSPLPAHRLAVCSSLWGLLTGGGAGARTPKDDETRRAPGRRGCCRCQHHDSAAAAVDARIIHPDACGAGWWAAWAGAERDPYLVFHQHERGHTGAFGWMDGWMGQWNRGQFPSPPISVGNGRNASVFFHCLV